MEKSSKRGKIPQSDWPSIMARYQAGETLVSIAKTYDCSPPAISYVVSRSRMRETSSESPPIAAGSQSEPQLVKASAGVPRSDTGAAATDAPPPPAAIQNGVALRPVREMTEAHAGHASPQNGSRGPNGLGPGGFAERDLARALVTARPVGAANGAATGAGDQRRPPQLSLGNGAANGAAPANRPSGNGAHDPMPSMRGNGHGNDHGAELHPERRGQPGSNGTPPHYGAHYGTSGDERLSSRPPFPPQRGQDRFPEMPREADRHAVQQKETAGSYIDGDLRARVSDDVSAFLAAFDAALAEDTQESRSTLREATDRLLRAGARTRIELERLEARLPLPPRPPETGHAEPAWRQR